MNSLIASLPPTSALVPCRDIMASSGMSPADLSAAIVAAYKAGLVSPHGHDFPRRAAEDGAVFVESWGQWVIGVSRRSN